jgi:hypothetical protein
VIGIDILIKTDLMIACNNNFVFEIEFFKEIKEIFKMEIFAIPGEVTSMNENIPFLLFLYQFQKIIVITMSI